MISYEGAMRRIEFAREHGTEAALTNFNITLETLQRYQRLVEEPIKEQVQLPNILVFDIETAPMEVYVWGLYKQRISHDNVIMDWFVLTWAAKWLFSQETYSASLTPQEALAGDDKRILKMIWDLFESADVVIAHNAKRFDIRRLNARWMTHGMKPPSPYLVIDTLLETQKIGAFASHKLDFLGKILKNKGKIDTDFKLWKKCKAGDQESLDYMLKYNIEDTGLLEEVYLYIRPWIRSHPNVGLFTDDNDPVCATCGSKHIHEIDPYITSVGIYKGYRCEDCGGISRGRFTEVSLKKRKKLLRSTSR